MEHKRVKAVQALRGARDVPRTRCTRGVIHTHTRRDIAGGPLKRVCQHEGVLQGEVAAHANVRGHGVRGIADEDGPAAAELAALDKARNPVRTRARMYLISMRCKPITMYVFPATPTSTRSWFETVQLGHLGQSHGMLLKSVRTSCKDHTCTRGDSTTINQHSVISLMSSYWLIATTVRSIRTIASEDQTLRQRRGQVSGIGKLGAMGHRAASLAPGMHAAPDGYPS